MQCNVFIATSLDGFIAREDGGIDWLGDPAAGAEDHGFQAFFDSVDALVMGRNTYELVRTFPSWPYGEKRVVVLTSRPLDLPPAHRGRAEAMSGSPTEVVARLAARGHRRLYVDGGVTIQRFLLEGLIDEMVITRIPILLGSGIPLFGDLPHDVHLRHLETRSYESGLVQSRYEVLGAERGEMGEVPRHAVLPNGD